MADCRRFERWMVERGSPRCTLLRRLASLFSLARVSCLIQGVYREFWTRFAGIVGPQLLILLERGVGGSGGVRLTSLVLSVVVSLHTSYLTYHPYRTRREA